MGLPCGIAKRLRPAARQGPHDRRVAFHHNKPRDICPYVEGHLRELWLKGYDTTSKRGTQRPDMYSAVGAGFFAFRGWPSPERVSCHMRYNTLK